MKGLIDRHDAYVFLTEYYNHRTEIQHMALREALSRVPDGVVKCKDCASRVANDCYWNEFAERKPDDFCSRGERKANV